MANQNPDQNENPDQSESCQDKIEQRIEEQLYESGYYDYWQANHPELFGILVSQIRPKLREYLLCKCQLENQEKELKNLDEELGKKGGYAKKTEATLRLWERNINWVDWLAYWLNNGFDWVLKAGLTVVPLLSLFSIANITIDEALNNPKKLRLVFVVLYVSIALIWLTSATIYNLIISHNGIKQLQSTSTKSFVIFWQTSNKTGNKFAIRVPPILRGFINSLTKYWLVWMMVFIWLSEGLLGWVVIPKLMDAAGFKKIGFLEKFEILVGIAIFAFINILFSVAKGMLYKRNLQYKMRYAEAIERWNGLKQKRAELVKKIAKLEEKIKELEPKIYPFYEMEYIRTQNQILSNEVNSGYDYRGKNPAKYGIKKGNQSEQPQKPPAQTQDGKPNEGNSSNGSIPEIPEVTTEKEVKENE